MSASLRTRVIATSRCFLPSSASLPLMISSASRSFQLPVPVIIWHHPWASEPKSREQCCDPHERCEQDGEEHRCRAEILGHADGGVLLRLDVIAQALDRRVEKLDREKKQQAADERYPGPNIGRDEEGHRQCDQGDGHFLLDRGLGAEALAQAADRVPQRGPDAGDAAAAGQRRLRAEMLLLRPLPLMVGSHASARLKRPSAGAARRPPHRNWRSPAARRPTLRAYRSCATASARSPRRSAPRTSAAT